MENVRISNVLSIFFISVIFMQHYWLFEYKYYLVYLFFENMLTLNKNTTIFLIFSMILIAGCGDTGFFKKPDWSEPAIDGKELARKNVREGKGIQIKPNKEQGGNFLFASSNPMWRASLETIDFMPLLTVDYAGGLIITDWYTNENIKNKRIKITAHIRTSELRSDGIKVKVHVQKLINNVWSNTVTDENLASKIENSILNEARNLRVNANK